MNFSAEKFSDDKEDTKDKKKKSKSGRFGSFVPLVEPAGSAEAAKPKAESKDQSASDKLLAELAFAREKERQAADATKAPEKAEWPGLELDSGPADEPVSAEQAHEKLAETFTADYTKEIRANELPPDKLFAEGIIDLGKPDEEIIALHEQQREAKATQWRTQPEQQHRGRQESPADEPEPSSATDGVETTPETVPDEAVEQPEQVPDGTAAASDIEPPAAVPRQESDSAATPFAAFYNRPPNPPNPAAQPRPSSHTFRPPNANTAPVNPNVANPAAPNNLQNPNAAYFTPMSGVPNPNQAPAATNPNTVNQKYVTQQQLEDEVYYATKHGQRRGVLAGLVTGAWIEHTRHKRREKRQAKKVAQQQKQYEKERETQKFQLAEQAKKTNATERQVRDLQAAERRRQFATRSEAMPTPLTNPERSAGASAKTAAAPEKSNANSFSGKLEKLVPKKPERAGKPGEAVVAERLEVPAEHRLETSAWHTIEVDAKTGKAVENPTFAYGEEYYRERAKETGPRATPTQKQAAGEVALVAASLRDDAGVQASDGSGSQPAGYPASASTQQRTRPTQLLGSKAKSLLKPGKSAAPGAPHAAPLWPMVVGFIAIVILIIIAL